MAGILLITHNGLGDSLIDCVRHVMGSVPPHLKALSVLADEDPEKKEEEARALIALMGTGEMLVLSDVYGATPCNIAQRLCRPGSIEGVAGVNLPMLLRVVSNSNKPLAELVQRALEGGKECIVTIDWKGCDAATGCANH